MSQAADAGSDAPDVEADPDPRTVKARVSDKDLLAAIEDAEEDETMAEVLRGALRSDLLADDEAGDADDLVDADVSVTARRGYEVLREVAGEGHMVEVEAAKSVVAERTNIPAKSVRSMVFNPLKRQGLIGVAAHIKSAFITVRSPEVADV